MSECVWKPMENEPNDFWKTNCGNSYENDTWPGTPVEKGFKFCPYCGGVIIEKKPEETNEANKIGKTEEKRQRPRVYFASAGGMQRKPGDGGAVPR